MVSEGTCLQIEAGAMCPRAQCRRAAPASGSWWGISGSFTDKQEMSFEAVSEDVQLHLYDVKRVCSPCPFTSFLCFRVPVAKNALVDMCFAPSKCEMCFPCKTSNGRNCGRAVIRQEHPPRAPILCFTHKSAVTKKSLFC